MKAQKVFLNIEPQDIDDFSVIAIHSNLEAYLLAYRLNQNLGCLLQNTKKKSLDDIYTRFKYISKISNDSWELISNHYKNEESHNKTNLLFDINETNKKSLIPTLDLVDFFFKTPKSKITSEWVTKIRNIAGIQLVYKIDKRILYNLENLIFD
ncbi:IPExxxVDY family protein [Bacteroidota bacterium]|nr:IPExxxVDY family protein [Bacteroidota bacterium]